MVKSSVSERKGAVTKLRNEQTEDFNIAMEHIRYSPSQQYYGTKILFVIKGSIWVTYEGSEEELRESDILFINRNSRYSIIGEEDSILISLSISSHFFALHYKNYFHSYFQTFSNELNTGRETVMQQMRHLLSEMILEKYRDEDSSSLVTQSSVYQIMLMLTRFFKKEVPLWEGTEVSDERIVRIIQMIEQRYTEPLTLSEIAESEFLSPSYLSRYFKQMTGIGFLQYLYRVRLKHSMEDLLYTTDNLFQIANKNGFSTAKNYSAVFKAAYNQTPSEYRKEHQLDDLPKRRITEDGTEVKSVMESPAVLVQLAKYLDEGSEQNFIYDKVPVEEREVVINKEIEDTLGKEQHLVFIGQLKSLLDENIQKQVVTAHQELGVDFVGIYNLIKGSTLLPEVETDEVISTSPVHAISDLALEFLKEQQIGLFIRIDYQEIIDNEDNFFKRFDHFMQHALHVFGRQFVEKWHVLFQGPDNDLISADELKRLYLKLWQLLEKRTRQINVGYYISFDERKDDILADQYWIFEERQKIDFISYDADQNDLIDFDKISDKDFINSQNYILDKTHKLKIFLKKHQMNKPLCLNNWNTLTGNTRYTNGTFFRGALILRTVLELSKEVKSIGFWINNQVHEKSSSSRNILIDGLELFHFFNGKRPVYYAMMFKERLHGKIVARGEDFLMTENENGYQIILFNERRFNPQYSTDELFIQSRSKELHFRLNGLEKSNYQIRLFRFDSENGGLYKNWRKLNSQYGIDREIINYIVQSAKPSLELKDDFIEDSWSFYSFLDINAIHFIEMRKVIE
ncbi:helix-turn-helix domain-containing protein [Desemzia sp. RIT 804]|uniref:helix-turn-helix domain-containing protein n=1 Tax=Desemzia sp. RIT 804 TaxID=2810209 RepID=UPI001F1BA998|nr:helix-turn-helix domain-containing protein [Desemzia sp. RIT 804]